MTTNLASVKEYLGITTTDSDATLTALIESVGSYIENVTGRNFSEVVDFTEEISGHEEFALNLAGFPVTDTTTRVLEHSNTHTNEDDWETVDTKEWWVDKMSGIIYINSKFVGGVQNYRFTYSFGYSEVPKDIELISNMMVAELFNGSGAGAGSDGSANIKREKIGDYEITYKDDENKSFIMSVLNQYTK